MVHFERGEVYFLKIQFTCFNCGESFNITTENLAKKSSLYCPNCENLFPQINFETLKKLHAIITAASAGLVTQDEEGVIHQHWDFKFVD